MKFIKQANTGGLLTRYTHESAQMTFLMSFALP